MKTNALFSTSASWVSRFISLASQIVLLPVLYRELSASESGLWLLLFQANALVALLEFGFGAAFTRTLSFELTNKNPEPHSIITTARVVIIFLSILAFLASSILGLILLITQGDVFTLDVGVAWLILCLANSFKILASFSKSLLNAYKFVGLDAVVSIASQFVLIGSQILALSLGGGVQELALTYLITMIFSLFILRLVRTRCIQPVETGNFSREILSANYNLMIRGWLTGIAAFLLLKTDYYIIGAFGGLESVPEFYAANQLIQNIHTLAIALTIASTPFISRAFRSGDSQWLNAIVQSGARFAFLTWAIAASFLLISAKHLFSLWLGPEYFVGYLVISLLLVASFAETLHIIISGPIRATGKEIFFISGFIAAVVNLSLSIYLGLNYGVVGVVLATIIAQTVVNVAFAYRVGFPHLQVHFLQFALQSCGMPALAAIVNSTVLISISFFIKGEGLAKLILMLATSAVVFLFFAVPILKNNSWRNN